VGNKPRKTVMDMYDDIIRKSGFDQDMLQAWDERIDKANQLERNTLVGGTKILTHHRGDCKGYWCCIHNPSPHHMITWEQHFSDVDSIVYRICKHGEMHPDPDDPNAWAVHNSHGCMCHCCGTIGKIKRRSA